MKIKAKLYVPKKWTDLDRPLRKRFQEVEKLLRTALCASQPTYEQLADFAFRPAVQTHVRKTIAEAVKKRPPFSYTMTHEIACFQRALREELVRGEDSIYSAASAVRSLLFKEPEPLRTFNMTISYHDDWMCIAPPEAADPVFTLLSAQEGEPAIFRALNTYLILLTSHPFSDGNGRTSRLMFNILLAKAYAITPHYIPLNELTRSTQGVYEENIADACRDGDFRQLILLLLGLLKSYALFLRRGTVEGPKSEVARVLGWAADRQNGSEGPGINDIPPYMVSVSDIVGHADESSINKAFLGSAVQIANSLSEYGTIEFAITGLADLTERVSPKTNAIAFFIKANRKEDLLLHFRELRAKYSRTLKLQVALASGDAAIDAKLLVTLFMHYTCHDPAATSCPILLHDFGLVSDREPVLL